MREKKKKFRIKKEEKELNKIFQIIENDQNLPLESPDADVEIQSDYDDGLDFEPPISQVPIIKDNEENITIPSTEKKEDVQMIKESEEMYEKLFETGVGAVIWDPKSYENSMKVAKDLTSLLFLKTRGMIEIKQIKPDDKIEVIRAL